ncbi:hypothetical protein D3C72_1741100 [compost metagenome]
MQGVIMLCYNNQGRSFVRADTCCIQHFYRFFKTFCNLSSLICNTLSLEFFRFCFCFCNGNNSDSLRFRFIFCSRFFTFCRVDSVHRMFHLIVRINICYQGFYNIVTITLHSFLKFCFYCDCNIIFFQENII